MIVPTTLDRAPKGAAAKPAESFLAGKA